MAEKEFIEREAFLDAIERMKPYHQDADDIAEMLQNFPAADVRPVVRGKWEWNKNNGFYYCSKCGAISPREDQDGEYCDCPNFCPNCGAMMEES